MLLEASGAGDRTGDPRRSSSARSPSSSSGRRGRRSRSCWPTSAEQARPRPGFALNLGHSPGHALEAAAGFHDLLHGEAVAYGLRVGGRLGGAWA